LELVEDVSEGFELLPLALHLGFLSVFDAIEAGQNPFRLFDLAQLRQFIYFSPRSLYRLIFLLKVCPGGADTFHDANCGVVGIIVKYRGEISQNGRVERHHRI
jgi:hypothetical protein